MRQIFTLLHLSVNLILSDVKKLINLTTKQLKLHSNISKKLVYIRFLLFVDSQ